MTITVAICTRRRPIVLQQCLLEVNRLVPAPDEVLVIDNSQGDRDTELVAKNFNARYVIESRPGLSRARNRALRESNCEIVAYLDDDAIPDKRWLEFLVAPFEDPAVGVVTGETLESPADAVSVGQSPGHTLDTSTPHWFTIASWGGLGFGTNMAFRKSACAGWTVFDERLGRGAPLYGNEEHCAYAKMLAHNFSAVHVPSACVFHSVTPLGNLYVEARDRVAYWLLLFSEFPSQRMELIHFLFRRFRRKPKWTRDSPEPGPVVNSGWKVLLKAAAAGTILFFRVRRSTET